MRKKKKKKTPSIKAISYTGRPARHIQYFLDRLIDFCRPVVFTELTGAYIIISSGIGVFIHDSN